MRVSEAIGRTLAGCGVEAFFGLVGSGNFALVDALLGAGARFYSARHECGALMMADGYARVSGRVGVCTTHQGPGFTNALTGLVEAAKNRTPLLLLAADTPPGTLWSNFQVDQAALARTAGAIAERVRSAETAAEDAARAHHRALAERRPVVLNVPADLPPREFSGVPEARPRPLPEPPRPAARAVERLADLIQAARRPVILAGRGAALSEGARGALAGLGERVGALLATSAMAHGLFSGEPYAVGVAGGFSSPLAQELLAEADAVLAFGASLNRWTVRHGALFGRSARVAQVDLEPAALGRLHRVEVGVVGDAAETARAVLEELERRGVRREGYRTPEVRRAIASRRWRDEPYGDAGGDGYIDPRTFSRALDDLLPRERTLAVDSGHFMGYPVMYLEVPDERGFVFPNAFQSVGLGLGCALGAAAARPDRVAVAAVGDGGALMALGELESAVRHRLPVVIAVYNDAAYGAEVHHFGPLGYPVETARFPDTDFAALARAAGAAGVTVRAPEDLAPLKEWLARPEGPILLDAKVNPEVRAGWLEEAFRAH